MALTIETRGRRHYILGNTFPIKNQLRSAGAKWDPDASAWYTGKRDLAEKLAGTMGSEMVASSQQKSDLQGLDTLVTGRAQYRGHSYYVIWAGKPSRGQGCKLCFRDGSKIFWAEYDEVQFTKTYQTPKSIRSLQEYAQAAKDGRDPAEERAIKSGRCRCCHGPIQDASHHAAMGGYCGSCAFDEFDC